MAKKHMWQRDITALMPHAEGASPVLSYILSKVINSWEGLVHVCKGLINRTAGRPHHSTSYKYFRTNRVPPLPICAAAVPLPPLVISITKS